MKILRSYKSIFIPLVPMATLIMSASAYAITPLQEYEGLISDSMNTLSNVPIKESFLIQDSQGSSTTQGVVETDPVDKKSTGIFTISGKYQPTITIKNITVGDTEYSYMNGNLIKKMAVPISHHTTNSENFFSYMTNIRGIRGINFHGHVLSGLSGVVAGRNFSAFNSKVSGVPTSQVSDPVKSADVRIYFNPANGRVHQINMVDNCYQAGVSYKVYQTEKIAYLLH